MKTMKPGMGWSMNNGADTAWTDNRGGFFSPVFTDTTAYNNAPLPIKHRTRARRTLRTRPSSPPPSPAMGDVVERERRVCSTDAYWRVRPP